MSVTTMELTDSVVAITGGTGSFGGTMARHLIESGAKQVNIFSRDEAKQDEMRRKFADERLKFFLGDVRDASSIAPAMRGADYVFHAAALKQVPSCEFFPQQAVQTNINGSDNVIKEAEKAGVKSLVCLSTDKAVYPVNAMGMTKALMEKIAQSYSRNFEDSDMTVSVTRYGNVMYSRGSVIPLFVSQIQNGEPLTITDPKMTRFLMSLDDSVDLVKHAFLHANPGDLFVKKAPGSTVEVLARAVASLLGVEDPEIRIIGSRHGEKPHEALLSSEEIAKASDEGEYFRVPLDARSLQYELYFDQGAQEVSRSIDYDSSNTKQLSLDETKELLLKLPEMRKILGR
ncbi:polysaccharide biosynthesis protein [Corynebacterium glutamicum]|uniref:polysaccharide biosynthesis protein n=1 Tax=Corynebacterium glutamicum TaxID=1718 RepID=UPI00201631B8|nr:polysaccharide biosynthesis protein [Corynebacterium glutamicum]